MTVTPPYNMSFTSGALLYRESLVIAHEYQRTQSWDTTKIQVLNENLLQSRTQSTAKRLFTEIKGRLSQLGQDELASLLSLPEQDQKHILWLAICRTYGFIHDFAIEVLNQRFISLQPDLPKTEFDRFLEQKSSWYRHLEQLSPSTYQKLRQVFFRMLKEAGFINAQHKIQGTILSNSVVQLLNNNPAEFAFYPVSPTDIRRK